MIEHVAAGLGEASAAAGPELAGAEPIASRPALRLRVEQRRVAGGTTARGCQVRGCAYDVAMSSRAPMADAHHPQQADAERLDVAASVLGLLADRTRLSLLRRLGEGEADVTTLTEATGAARPSVSQHLAKLRLAGLVATRKDGRRVVYSLRHGHLRRLVDEALNVADHQLGSLPPHD